MSLTQPSPSPADLRHGIRGTLNALKLCVSALEMPLETSEKVQFLSDVENAAEKLGILVQELGECGGTTAANVG